MNGVCLYGYLRRMEKDAARLAFLLMRGESLEEIQTFHRWPPALTRRMYDSLRRATERCLAI